MRAGGQALIIGSIGLAGALVPLALVQGHAVQYLRHASDGVHGTTTPTPPPQRLPEHQERNQSDREATLPGVQIDLVTPASGGCPNPR